MYTCVPALARVCLFLESPEAGVNVSLNFSTLFSEIESFTEPGGLTGLLGWLTSELQEIFLSPPPQLLYLAFTVGTGDPNPGPHICRATAISTEPSP